MSFADGYNRVVGADFRWRFGNGQRIDAFAFASRSRDSALGARSGVGAQVSYGYDSQQWTIIGSGKHYDPQFEMTTAFINRVGIPSGWAFVDRSFYPDKDKYPWIRRLSVLSFTQGGRDRLAGRGNDLLAVDEPRPGTVVHAGYGSLLEQREFVDAAWVTGEGHYGASCRGLFFTTSYLHRF